jgi:hypothetical protein
MTLTVPEITRVAETVGHEATCRFRIQSVAALKGGSDRVELLVAVEDEQNRDRLVLLNVSRQGAARLEDELRAKLQEFGASSSGD